MQLIDWRLIVQKTEQGAGKMRWSVLICVSSGWVKICIQLAKFFSRLSISVLGQKLSLIYTDT